MGGYESKQSLIEAILKTAKLFIDEFEGIEEVDKMKLIEGMDRTPGQMLAYQLGWMYLIIGWDRAEMAGKQVITPTSEHKWNQLGELYESFYRQYEDYSLDALRVAFDQAIQSMVAWVDGFSEEELMGRDMRRWASSTPSKWPIWKWVHINTVAPFKSFRTKIRKWKKLNSAC